MRKVDPVRHAARRRHILDAAAVLFATRGFDGTTTADICAAAGISAGNLYHYFRSKREVFAAVLADDGETGQHLAAARRADDPWEGLVAFVDHLVAPSLHAHVPTLVLEAMLQAHRDPDLAARLDRDSAEEHAGVRELLQRAADAGRIDPGLDLDSATSWVMALVDAMYLRAAFDETFDPAAQRETLRLILQRFLRAQGHHPG